MSNERPARARVGLLLVLIGTALALALVGYGSGSVLSGSAAKADTVGSAYALTLDKDADISAAQLAQQVAAIQALPLRPTVRIVVDIGTTPNDYASAIPAIAAVAPVMLELGDSSEVNGVPLDSYSSWVQSFVSAYASEVSLWEVGNEANGPWTGPVSDEVARFGAAYNIVSAAGGKTALTLFYNSYCADGNSDPLFSWLAAGNVPANMEAGLSEVLLSFYPSLCNNYWPTPATWQSTFDQLHAQFPNSLLGFGESGQSGDSLSASDAVALLDQYVAVNPTTPNYSVRVNWWYFAEDGVPADNAFWQGYATAEQNPPPPPVATVPTTTVAPASAILNELPSNVIPPTIRGTARVGQRLTLLTGRWTNQPTSYLYRWQRCLERCVNIGGATGVGYTLGARDLGQKIALRVWAKNSAGASRSSTAPLTATVGRAVGRRLHG